MQPAQEGGGHAVARLGGGGGLAVFEALLAGRVDWMVENDARRWATSYDVPALREGRLLRHTQPHVGSGIAWHRDAANRYMPTARAAFVRAMICLDGMDAANGGTAFRPGSHLAAPEGAEVVERCPPGAIVLIHPRVLHGGAPNRSARPRRNLIVQWGRADDPPLGEARESLTGLSPAEVLALGGG